MTLKELGRLGNDLPMPGRHLVAPLVFPFPPTTKRGRELNKVTTVAQAGAAVGYGIAAAKGLTAVGVLAAKGAGFGSAAGPVGAVVGATVAVAGYGVYRAMTS